MENIIIIAILLIIVSSAASYIIKAKKSGKKCIGCPGGCRHSSGISSFCQGCSDDK